MSKVLCLSPATLIFSSKKEVLFYDYETGAFVKYENQDSINDFVTILQNPDNMYTICENDIPHNKAVQELIQLLSSNYMIDYLEYDKVAPIVIPPFLKCHEELWAEESSETSQFISPTDLYIYLNGECDHGCNNCKKLAFQMTHCIKDDGEIRLDDIKHLISETKSFNEPITFHLCGGDIGKYSSLHALSILLAESGIRPLVHLSYLNLNSYVYKQLEYCNPTYIVSIDFPISYNAITSVVKEYKTNNLKLEFIVTSDDDIYTAERIIKAEKLKNFSLVPFYNGNNIDFFKQNVFMEEEDILKSKPSKQMIYRRMIFNVNNIGKIILRSNGTYYANLNKSALGNIAQPLTSIIEKEWESKESWRDTRTSKSCSRCLYQYLCPSPSNYEYVIKRNLCFHTHKYEK